jgi:drug/metabolite transporter (DMT)-like permease
MTRRWLFGLILLLGVVLIWVLSSTFMQYIFLEQNFAHPFFLTYISTSLFTIYLIGFVFCKSWRSGNKTSEWVLEEEQPPLQQTGTFFPQNKLHHFHFTNFSK